MKRWRSIFNQVIPVLSFIDHLHGIRRSRRRLRKVEETSGRLDKASAYATLYETLVTFAKKGSVPFMFDRLPTFGGWVKMAEPGKDGVHLCDTHL